MTTLTRDQLIALNPCGLDDRLKLFGRRKSMTVKQALAAGASVDDVLWVAGRLGLKDECARFAVKCAERVVHLDTSGTAQPCIDATLAYLADPSAKNRKILSAAGDAAVAAARAAAGDATQAAARAATRAAWATLAAWDAARAAAGAATLAAARAAAGAATLAAGDAAGDAARAAWVAAGDAETEAQKLILMEIFG